MVVVEVEFDGAELGAVLDVLELALGALEVEELVDPLETPLVEEELTPEEDVVRAEVGVTTEAVVSRLVPSTRVLPLTGTAAYDFPGSDWRRIPPHMRSSTSANACARKSPPSGVKWTPSGVRTRTDFPFGPTGRCEE